jgi:hypothetical protein
VHGVSKLASRRPGLFLSITTRDELEPLDEAIEGMTKASDMLKEKWTQPDVHDLMR